MKKHKKNVSKDRLSPEEEAAYQAVEDLVARYTAGTWIASPKKIHQVKELYEALADSLADQKVEVKLKLNDPFPWFSAISVIGESIIFDDKEIMLEMIRQSNNMEVGSRLDNKTEVNFAFTGTSIKISE